MAIQFPANPQVGDPPFTDPTSGESWTWDGVKWNLLGIVQMWQPDGDDIFYQGGQIRVEETRAASNGVLRLQGSDADHGGAVIGQNSNGDAGPLELWSGGTRGATIDAAGHLLVGMQDGQNVATGTQARLQVQADANNGVRGIAVVDENDIPGTFFGRGTAALGSGAGIGILAFAGHDGNSLGSSAAHILVQTDGTTAANSVPGRITFATTPEGGTAPVERLRINQAGAIGLAGANFGNAGQVLTSQGNGAAPQWADAGGGDGAGVVAAWATQNDNGSLAAGGNISSASSPGTGQYRLNFTNNVGSNAAVACICDNSNAPWTPVIENMNGGTLNIDTWRTDDRPSQSNRPTRTIVINAG